MGQADHKVFGPPKRMAYNWIGFKGPVPVPLVCKGTIGFIVFQWSDLVARPTAMLSGKAQWKSSMTEHRGKAHGIASHAGIDKYSMVNVSIKYISTTQHYQAKA